jgi:CelD/BcsL family acetyltransferase involved in cellulose biosynthesis
MHLHSPLMPALAGKLFRTADDYLTAIQKGRDRSPGVAAGPVQYDIAQLDPVQVDDALLAKWSSLLARSTSEEKLYQTPAFFRYLQETAGPHHPYAVFSVTRRADGELVGLVPVRLIEQDVDFRAARLGTVKITRLAVQILGSVPMLPEPGLLPMLAQRLLQHWPQASAVSMQAMPRSEFGRLGALPGWRVRVLDGWRECHTVSLPESRQDYLHGLSSKRRYNLSRQLRLLAVHAGEIALQRIDQPEQVGALFDALRALMSADEFAAYPPPEKFASLAAHGLLLSYVMRCGGTPVGVVVATRAERKWHVHNIFCAWALHQFSPGTGVIHMALCDLLDHAGCAEADFGYGTPNQDFTSARILKTRGHVLLYRPRSTMALVLALHRWYAKAYDRSAAVAKQALRRLARPRR